MTGDELRTHIKTLGISKRQFADTLAEKGHYMSTATLDKIKTAPLPAVNLITQWLTNPSSRPAAKRGRYPK